MKITEIFHSLQGESSWAGLPCVFVRMSGCNLRCVWCDTDYAFFGGREMTVTEVMAEVERIGESCRLVQLTGGEPLLQKDIGRLAQQLLDRGYTVLCETSGSLDVGKLPAEVVKIMDIKCPGSGEANSNRWSNLGKLGPDDEVKFVIRDRTDYDWALAVIEERSLAGRKLLFAPVWGELQPRVLADWMLRDGVPARLQAQLHKLIWSPNEAGV
jgi:7-carboxy-7-deazaguanine synthase